jgi:beta-phosphoglucomutase
MTPIKAIIFDLDGVIVTTEHNHYLAWKKTADQLGIPFSENENEMLKGLSRIDSLKVILHLGNKEISDDQFNQLIDEKNTFYRESIANLSREDLLPGVLNVLEQAKSKGIPLAVGSASKNAPFIVGLLELDPYFEIVVDGTMVKNPKPNPEVFLCAAKHLNVDPAECIVLEDAESGINAAKAGGFRAIGVGNKHIAELADYYLNDLTEFNFNI